MQFSIARYTPPHSRAIPKEAHDPEWHQRLLEAVPGLILVGHAPPLAQRKPYLSIIVEGTRDHEIEIRKHLGTAFLVGVIPVLMEHIPADREF